MHPFPRSGRTPDEKLSPLRVGEGKARRARSPHQKTGLIRPRRKEHVQLPQPSDTSHAFGRHGENMHLVHRIVSALVSRLRSEHLSGFG